jgi:hypothetical protein
LSFLPGAEILVTIRYVVSKSFTSFRHLLPSTATPASDQYLFRQTCAELVSQHVFLSDVILAQSLFGLLRRQRRNNCQF